MMCLAIQGLYFYELRLLLPTIVKCPFQFNQSNCGGKAARRTAVAHPERARFECCIDLYRLERPGTLNAIG